MQMMNLRTLLDKKARTNKSDLSVGLYICDESLAVRCILEMLKRNRALCLKNKEENLKRSLD